MAIEYTTCISSYNPVCYKDDETVMTKFEEKSSIRKSYVSEAVMEDILIAKLQMFGYEVVNVKTSEDLISNLRAQIEKLNLKREKGLNGKPFSDTEWARFYDKITRSDLGVIGKTKMIQHDPRIELVRDDGTSANILIFNHEKEDENSLQVMHQFEGNSTKTGAKYDNRYDVTILVNGLPLVHIELKRYNHSLKEAYNQIERYKRDSFWAGTGLFEFVQIFVISNGANTRYYSNTLRERQYDRKKYTKGTFKETSIWADGTNLQINKLENFTDTFLCPSVIRKILARYCIFDVENNLKIMRPYQIYGTEQIIHNVEFIEKNNKWGCHKNNADGTFERPGGFIWHSTGSGKTLTSFKTSILLSNYDYIDAVLFVVDRRDISYQTEREFNRFQEGSVDGTDNTAVLLSQLKACANGTAEKKIIITTIQKLHCLVKNNKKLDIYNKKVVFLFDECHRSQFGKMHSDIVKTFKQYAMYGFTGTPVKPQNAKTDKGIVLTTEQTFGKCLHSYLTTDSIRDGNTLPWNYIHYSTFSIKPTMKDEKVAGIDKKSVFLDETRIRNIVDTIIDDFPRLTYRGQKDGNMCGMLTVSSIEAAKKYYQIFKDEQAKKGTNYKVSTIFTAFANEEDVELSEDTVSLEGMDKNSLDFLNEIVFKDYKDYFGSSFTTSTFYNYYKDLSRRIRGVSDYGDKLNQNDCVDIVIVVDMLTTGFDAPRINTIWIDKHIKWQRLFQLISRSIRRYGPLKTHGNICAFVDLDEEIDEAIELFCGRDSKALVLMRSFNEYLNGYVDENGKEKNGIADITFKLKKYYPVDTEAGWNAATQTTEKQKNFIKEFGQYITLRHILTSFDSFEASKTTLEEEGIILTQGEFDLYEGKYLDLRDEFNDRVAAGEVDIIADLVFEIELLKQYDIDLDYIFNLLENAVKDGNLIVVKAKILKLVESNVKLRSKKELIEIFLSEINGDCVFAKEWEKFIKNKLEEEIDELVSKYNLDKEKTFKLFSEILAEDIFDANGAMFKKINDIKAKKTSFFDKKSNDFNKDIYKSFEELYNKYKEM